MKTLAFSIVTALLLGLACVKADVPKGTPRCVKNKVTDFEKNDPCADAKVDEYLFQSQTVYVFDSGTCIMDGNAEVINSDCRSMGYLGGLAGNRIINGESFDNAKFVKTIWKKQ